MRPTKTIDRERSEGDNNGSAQATGCEEVGYLMLAYHFQEKLEPPARLSQGGHDLKLPSPFTSMLWRLHAAVSG